MYDSQNIRVLVVDDNSAGLYSTSRVLRAVGFEVLEAASGAQALNVAKNHMPDVVLLDVKLPDISGFEVCRRIKENKATSIIPVIHLSATYMDSESQVQGLEGGADAYLTHPTEPKVLIATIHAVLRIRQAEGKLHTAAIKWQTTFDTINDSVCLINADGRINQSNKAFKNIFNYSDLDINGKMLSEIAKEFENYTPEFFRNIYENMINDLKAELCFRDQWFLISVDSIKNENGIYSGSVFKMTDISSQKKFEDQLRKTMNELERSNKELEQFAFIASHDLQEPLRMISVHLQLIEKKLKGKLDDGTARNINFAVEGSQRMHNLITDLLEYSRVATKAANFSTVDLNSVMNNVLMNLQLGIEANSATINYEKLPEIRGDEIQLNQLFQNLIANALKFRSAENPFIQITVKERQEEWLFSVSDNGVGIEPQYYEKIFIIFQRLQQNYPGTGIGLAICKKIVERHKGNIWVEQTNKKGTTISFTISKNL